MKNYQAVANILGRNHTLNDMEQMLADSYVMNNAERNAFHLLHSPNGELALGLYKEEDPVIESKLGKDLSGVYQVLETVINDYFDEVLKEALKRSKPRILLMKKAMELERM